MCVHLLIVADIVIQTVIMVVHIIAAMTVMVLHVIEVAVLIVEDNVTLVVQAIVILMDVI